MTQYLVTLYNGDYPLTYWAKTIREAFQCILEAEKNHKLNRPDFFDANELMETLVEMKNDGTPKVMHISGYEVQRVNAPAPFVPILPVPDWLEDEQKKWRRFELTVTSKEQVDELNTVLANSNFTRRDLALIVTCLRPRPEFSLDDFTAKTDNGEPFASADP